MQFSELQKRAIEIREKYAESENRQGREWSRADIVRGFVGDVGDLAKLSMAEDGVRKIENSSEKMAHELADCLWSVMVIADKYGVDLEKSFFNTMDELDQRIDSANGKNS